MGRGLKAGVLAALLLGGLAGCGNPPATLILDRPLPSNRFHPLKPAVPPKGADKGVTQRGG